MTQDTLVPAVGRFTSADFSLRAATSAAEQLSDDIRWAKASDAARLAGEVASLMASLQTIEDRLRAAS